MRWKNGLIIGGAILALLAGAAVFQRFAPENYGAPEIEIVDPGPSGVRIAADGLFGNFYPATGEGPHAGVLMLGGSEGGLGGGATHMARELQREGFGGRGRDRRAVDRARGPLSRRAEGGQSAEGQEARAGAGRAGRAQRAA